MLAIDDGSSAVSQVSSADVDEERLVPAGPNSSSPVTTQDDIPNSDGHSKIVRLLLQHGADVHAAAHDGATALSLARKQHFSQVVTLLTQAGARR